MTIETAFSVMMTQTVSVYAKTSRDAYGKGTFSGTAATFKARVQEDRDVTSGTDMREVMETGTVYAYGTPTVTVDDKIVLPDATVCKVTQVTIVSDENGPHHTVIRFGPG